LTSKSPFTSQVTSYVKFGQTSQQAAGVNDYLDYGIRATYAFTPKLVAKGNYTHIELQSGMLRITTKLLWEEIEVM
jgi:hypothetical protein